MKATLLEYIYQLSDKNPLLSAFFALIKDSSAYLIGGATIGLANLVLVPIYTRSLTPGEFGIFALIDITILIIVTITQLGLGVSYLKWFADLGDERRSEILSSTLTISTVAAIVGSGILTIFLMSPYGNNWIIKSNDTLIWLLIPIIILENVLGLFLSDLRAHRRPVAYSLSMVLRLISIVAASIFLVVLLDRGIIGIFLGRLIGDFVGVSILSLLCLPKIKIKINLSISKAMLLYGTPLVWSALMAMMLDASGRYFIQIYGTIEQVGYYSLAVKISGIYQMIVYIPFGAAWGGLIFQIVKWTNARLIYSKILSYLIILSLCFALILSIFSPSIFRIFAPASYFPSLIVFPLVVFVRAVTVLQYPTSVGIFIGDRTRFSALVYSIGLLVNLLGIFILFPIYGIIGIAVAWLFSWITIIMLMTWIGQFFYKLIFSWRIIILSILTLVLILINYQSIITIISNLGLLNQILISSVLICIVIIFLIQDFRSSRYKFLESEVSS